MKEKVLDDRPRDLCPALCLNDSTRSAEIIPPIHARASSSSSWVACTARAAPPRRALVSLHTSDMGRAAPETIRVPESVDALRHVAAIHARVSLARELPHEPDGPAVPLLLLLHGVVHCTKPGVARRTRRFAKAHEEDRASAAGRRAALLPVVTLLALLALLATAVLLPPSAVLLALMHTGGPRGGGGEHDAV
eukprot:CAMPEP_0119099064 /NCGR_PEP_ID=MMETSP1178-20130426/184901_1 /TAXON_ID=33656 /ORGANISM="unid sp, Strain CCMP2000" /LENGTH=192 /DNA_ID=CAMNT_0007083043 /DNA_START=28 /DNA_END=607 /DNA_ORIENTATION=-